MGELAHPADAIERDGDVISGADYNSLEYNLPLNDVSRDEFEELAFQAAAELVDSPIADAADEAEAGVSEAERLYDIAAEKVERRREQGIDAKAAWYEVDPTGAIKKNFAQEQRQKQDALNHAMAEKIRQATHDANVAIINKIIDPVKRKSAMGQLLAQERIAKEKKNRY
jgi:hypothetical protein